jgi:hypothetical protein
MDFDSLTSEASRHFGKNILENAANRFAANSQPVVIPAKPVGNQLALISVHYRSSPQPYQPMSVKAKSVSMGQMPTIASREKNFEKTL